VEAPAHVLIEIARSRLPESSPPDDAILSGSAHGQFRAHARNGINVTGSSLRVRPPECPCVPEAAAGHTPDNFEKRGFSPRLQVWPIENEAQLLRPLIPAAGLRTSHSPDDALHHFRLRAAIA